MYIQRGREENMVVLVVLSEGTMGGRRRKEIVKE
jgi:hypothetical protein